VDAPNGAHATGGKAKLLELYRVLSAKEAAEFLGFTQQTVRNMTSRHELPCVKNRNHAIGYRVIDLIEWLEAQRVPARV
jgi:excisionase family DNA binding protein